VWELNVDNAALRKWLAQPRAALTAAVAQGVRDHLESLKLCGIEFYGYALLPGDPHDIRSLVAVTNSDADIKVPPEDEQYRYFRFCVDEWAHWKRDRFAAAEALLEEANRQFASMHTKSSVDFSMDEFEIAPLGIAP
jgi:hypothetical protein